MIFRASRPSSASDLFNVSNCAVIFIQLKVLTLVNEVVIFLLLEKEQHPKLHKNYHIELCQQYHRCITLCRFRQSLSETQNYH